MVVSGIITIVLWWLSKKNDFIAMVNAQEFLDIHYPLEERNEIEYLVISNKALTDSLVIKDWVNLYSIEIFDNYLESLKIINCPNLNKLICFKSLKDLQIEECPLLTNISIYSNPITSLEFTKHLNNLKFLDIVNTNIKRGLEYLPESVAELKASVVYGDYDYERGVESIRKQLEKHLVEYEDNPSDPFNENNLNS